MTKKNYVSLVMGLVGGIIFAIGMCMCLIPEWDAFRPGVGVGIAGAVVLLIMLAVRRKMSGKSAVHLNGKTVGTVLLGIIGALVLGVGMCCVMVWGKLILGIALGVVSMVILLALIPICKGLE